MEQPAEPAARRWSTLNDTIYAAIPRRNGAHSMVRRTMPMFWSIPVKHSKGPLFLVLSVVAAGCGTAVREAPCLSPKTVVVYDNEIIPANRAIWKPEGIPVEGYSYATVFVEHEQHRSDEAPLEVGIGFAPWADGRAGARAYYDFETERRVGEEAPPRLRQPLESIRASGREGWHGSPHNKTSFGLRVPVLGPFMWVYPLNRYAEPRRFTIAVYLIP